MADTTVGLQFEYLGISAIPGTADEDAALVRALCSGESSAYETLLLRFEQPVYSLVSRLVDDPADAADVVQEVFLKVFRKIGSFRSESSLKTWIYRIAVNEARNQRRWFVRHKSKEVGLDLDVDDRRNPGEWLEDSSRSPYDIAVDHETRAMIEAALVEVSPNYRDALVLREVEGLSYEEVADILGISLGTVKSRILRGRESLRIILAERLKKTTRMDLALQFRPQGSDVL